MGDCDASYGQQQGERSEGAHDCRGFDVNGIKTRGGEVLDPKAGICRYALRRGEETSDTRMKRQSKGEPNGGKEVILSPDPMPKYNHGSARSEGKSDDLQLVNASVWYAWTKDDTTKDAQKRMAASVRGRRKMKKKLRGEKEDVTTCTR